MNLVDLTGYDICTCCGLRGKQPHGYCMNCDIHGDCPNCREGEA